MRKKALSTGLANRKKKTPNNQVLCIKVQFLKMNNNLTTNHNYIIKYGS